MKLSMLSIAASVALVFAGSTYAQSMPAAKKDTAPAVTEKKIEQEHKAEIDRCKPMKGNAQDICKAEANGKEKVAKAELKLQKKDSTENRRNLEETKAKTQYDVSNQRCDDEKDETRHVCLRQAKMTRDSAMAQTKDQGKGEKSGPTSQAPASKY